MVVTSLVGRVVPRWRMLTTAGWPRGATLAAADQ